MRIPIFICHSFSLRNFLFTTIGIKAVILKGPVVYSSNFHRSLLNQVFLQLLLQIFTVIIIKYGLLGWRRILKLWIYGRLWKKIMKLLLFQTIRLWLRLSITRKKEQGSPRKKACLFAAVSSTLFTRIMSLKSVKAIWDYLKTEYEGDERVGGMQVLNLIWDFELQKMKETESIKQYSNRFLNIANRVRLLGSSLPDSRIVEKNPCNGA